MDIRSTFIGSQEPPLDVYRVAKNLRSTFVGVFEVCNLVSTIGGAQTAYVLAWTHCLSGGQFLFRNSEDICDFTGRVHIRNVLNVSIQTTFTQYCIGVSCTIVNFESAFTGSPGTSARRLSGRQEPPLDVCRCI